MGILARIRLNLDSKRYVKIQDKSFKLENCHYSEASKGQYSTEDNDLVNGLMLVSGLTLEELKKKNIIYYLLIRRKVLKSNANALSYYTEGIDEKIIKYYQSIYKPIYEQYPEEERIPRWLQDTWNDPICLAEFNYNFKHRILEHYKKLFKYEGNYTVYELKPSDSFFPEMYKIFVCEELRVVHAFHAYELKTTKPFQTTLDADFANSPFFDPQMLTDRPQSIKWYKKYYTKKLKKLGFDTMNQEALIALINKRKNNARNLGWYFAEYGYKYGSNNIWYELEKTTNSELMNILKTYTLHVNPYFYKAFSYGNVSDYCEPGYQSDFEDSRYLDGCSLEQLEERKKTRSLSEYLGVTEDNEWTLDTKIVDEHIKKYKIKV